MRKQPIYILVNLASFESNKLVATCNKLVCELIQSIRDADHSYISSATFGAYQIEGEHILSLLNYDESSTLSYDEVLQLSIKKTLGTHDAQLALELLHNEVKVLFDNKDSNSFRLKPLVFYITDNKIVESLNDNIELFLNPKSATECITTNDVITGTNIRPIYVDYHLDKDAVSSFHVENALDIVKSINLFKKIER